MSLPIRSISPPAILQETPEEAERHFTPLWVLDRLSAAGWGDVAQHKIPPDVIRAAYCGSVLVPPPGQRPHRLGPVVPNAPKVPKGTLHDNGPCGCGCGRIVLALDKRVRYFDADCRYKMLREYDRRRKAYRNGKAQQRIMQ